MVYGAPAIRPQDGQRDLSARSGFGLAVKLGIGPVEPGAERLDIGGIDRGAAPDAQAGGASR
jgi:hypothetical protein